MAAAALACEARLNSVAAKYILAAFAGVFLIAAALRLVRDGGRAGPAPQTWLLVSAIFALVAAWLWYRR